MNASKPYIQLQMVWPAERRDDPPAVYLPPDYTLRTYRRGDEPRFYQLTQQR